MTAHVQQRHVIPSHYPPRSSQSLLQSIHTQTHTRTQDEEKTPLATRFFSLCLGWFFSTPFRPRRRRRR